MRKLTRTITKKPVSTLVIKKETAGATVKPVTTFNTGRLLTSKIPEEGFKSSTAMIRDGSAKGKTIYQVDNVTLKFEYLANPNYCKAVAKEFTIRARNSGFNSRGKDLTTSYVRTIKKV